MTAKQISKALTPSAPVLTIPDRYKIVLARSIEAVVKRVNSEMAAGWVPQGGLYVARGFFAQAILKPHEF